MSAEFMPAIGSVVFDTTLSAVGEVVSWEDGHDVWLRPLGDGPEWPANRDRLRPASPAEKMSVGVSRANSISRRRI
ncbi:hypothetical protein [Streptomyces sp. NPDC020141]|uniref:hypothetical protein n=1 Tax=Streptomyces sp. NPDC020141 TaxID=3365065 RepID=UPI0037B83EFA